MTLRLVALTSAAFVSLLGGGEVSARQTAPVAPAVQEAALPPAERVAFASMDDAKTELSGFLFAPAEPRPGSPAIVLMHGRAGLFSASADSVYSADTLTLRHRYWAEYWAQRGYYALLVDSFSSRGYPTGFAAGTYADRPASIDEVTIRPMDAYGALRFLRTLPNVADDRVALMGWSNGASATLATMADDKPGDMRALGFRAAIAMYPGCGMKRRFDRDGYRSYAPVEIFIGTADEEISYELCDRLVTRSRGLGAPVEMTTYEGASHGFDDPARRRQSVPANARATEDVRRRAEAFLGRALAVTGE